MLLYFNSSYIRLYSVLLFDNTRFMFIAIVVSAIISYTSIDSMLWIAIRFGKYNSFYFVSDLSKCIVAAIGIISFMF